MANRSSKNILYALALVCILFHARATFSTQLKKYPEIVSLTEKELFSNSKELDTKLLQAAQQGFFYVEIPAEAKELINDGVHFAHTFYKNHFLKTTKFPGLSTYYAYDTNQTEAFYGERSQWNTVYPKRLVALANVMLKVSSVIVRRIFPLVAPQLPRDQWRQATGGLFDDKGLYFLSFNHYRPGKKMVGVQPHRDISLISLLYIDKNGLFAKINDTWQPVPPKPGYFVVNFGKTFELLINDPSKLVASWHFVEQIGEKTHDGDRISFGLFSDINPNTPVQRITSEGHLEIIHPKYEDYLESSLEETFMDTPELFKNA